MESMDYNYFNPAATSAAQQYSYLNYGSNDAGVPAQSLESSLDATGYLAFDYNSFDPSLASGGLPGLTDTSASPPSAHALSLLPNDSGIGLDATDAELQGRRSSSEEKDNLTPAQSRRKAQNRAAQRAFRERKERHVRDLEAKLDHLTSTTSSLQSDNERLKLLLQRAQTENEILRATATAGGPAAHRPPSFVDDPASLLRRLPQRKPSPRPRAGAGTQNSTSTGDPDHPLLSANRLAHGLLSTDPATIGAPTKPSAGSKPDSDRGASTSSTSNNAQNQTTSTTNPGPTSSSPTSSTPNLLSASATWDLLQSHPRYLSGAVDLGEVCERLKRLARCDGWGPMFVEEEVRAVIDEVGRGGGDELI